jgi:predicted kinase
MNKFIMMIGLPASGKSTIAKEIALKENAVIHSSDELRIELYGDVNENDKNGELFQELYKRIKDDLKLNKNVILDSTNISYKRRMAVLNELKKIDCIKECYLIATPYEKCIEQNNLRDRKVPIGVIKEMYKNFFIPQYYEGWNKIEIVYPRRSGKRITDLINHLKDIDQENKHHTLTIGNHCLKCIHIIEKTESDINLSYSALLHDIGKEFTKEFKNSKGEETDEAHYYQHHLISAYNSLFYLDAIHCKDFNLLETIALITWHMQPFFIKTEKSKKKFINLVGEEFYKKLLILHQADISAK